MANDPHNQSPKEHQTHTGALIFLSLVTLVVCGVAYSESRMNLTPQSEVAATNQASLNPDNTASAVANAEELPADATTVEGLQGFPADLPVEVSAITENYEMPIPGQTERVLTYTTGSSTAELRDRYANWLAANGYELMGERRANIAASLAARNQEGGDLVVLIYTGTQDRRHVQLITHY